MPIAVAFMLTPGEMLILAPTPIIGMDDETGSRRIAEF
jgi:hypothetical protein